MALVDLITDLEKFKYDISGPDKVNAQIESGVDFFPDETSGATGFTPNIDLESRYHKYIEGPVVEPRTHDGTYYANLDPIANRGSLFINADGVYMVPAEGGNTLPPGGESGIPGFIEEQRTFNIGDHSLVNQPAGHSTNNPFQPDGPYNFMTTPIANNVSDFYPEENWSLTFEHSGFEIDGQFGSTFESPYQPEGPYDFMTNPISNVESRYPTDPSVTWDDQDGTMTLLDSPFTPISYGKQRGAFDEYYLGSDFAWSYSDKSLSEDILTTGTVGSIHISPGGEIEAGLRYGAGTNQTWVDYTQGASLTDVKSSPWPDISPHPQGAEVDRFSQLAYPYPESDVAGLYEWGSGEETLASKFDYTDFRDRVKKVYQNHYLTSPFTPIELPGLYSPDYDIRQRDLWKAGSIHIFDTDDKLTVFDHTTMRGRDYVVYEGYFAQTTENYQNIALGTDLFDETGDTQPWKDGSIHIPTDVYTNSTIGGGVSYYADLMPVTSRSSIFRDAAGNYQVPQAADQTLPPNDNLYPSTLSAYTLSPQQTLNLPYHTGLTFVAGQKVTLTQQLGPESSPLFGNTGWHDQNEYTNTVTFPIATVFGNSLLETHWNSTLYPLSYDKGVIWPANAPTHDLRRGVYNKYPLGANLLFGSMAFDSIYGSGIGITVGYYPSVHISKGGNIKAGEQYGAMTDQTFIPYDGTIEGFDVDTKLYDVASTPWSLPVGELPGFPSQFQGDFLSILANHSSRFVEVDENGDYAVTPNFPPSVTYQITPTNPDLSGGDLGGIDSKYPDAASTSLVSAGPDKAHNYNTAAAQQFSSGQTLSQPPLANLYLGGNDNLSSWDLSFGGTDAWGGLLNQHLHVPAGMSWANKFTSKSFKTVSANVGASLDSAYPIHPIIIRDFGTNWDSVLTDMPGMGGTIGGVIDGALSIFGLTTKSSRNIADKVRLVEWMKSGAGLRFIGKQFGMQFLNPTLETKFFNPLSTLGIAGLNELINGDGSFASNAIGGLLSAAASFILPVSHVERHVGGGRYDQMVPMTSIPNFILDTFDEPLRTGVEAMAGNISRLPELGWGSRIAMQSNPEVIEEVDLGWLGKFGGKDLKLSLMISNPNRYLVPVSSAPLTVVDGNPDFVAWPGVGESSLAGHDARRIENTAGGPLGKGWGNRGGGTFNKKTNERDSGALITKHSNLSYDDLNKDNAYYQQDKNLYDYPLLSAGEANDYDPFDETQQIRDSVRADAAEVGKQIGDPGKHRSMGLYSDGMLGEMDGFGLIKGDTKTGNVDKVNIHPYGSKDLKEEVSDFIKFRFYDIVNKKYIIFRAILDGISDSISTDYGEEKYIGRPDKLYVYQGADRSVSFNFKVYPKTKQEFPVLLEKLNYLVGLCYPSYTKENERMITPFIRLTIGDMFKNAPGVMDSLTVTVEDSGTWEIEEGLQFPHFISVACQFKYIGRDILATTGKHYGLDWLPNGEANRFAAAGLGFTKTGFPKRTEKYKKLFGQLSQGDEEFDRAVETG